MIKTIFMRQHEDKRPIGSFKGFILPELHLTRAFSHLNSDQMVSFNLFVQNMDEDQASQERVFMQGYSIELSAYRNSEFLASISSRKLKTVQGPGSSV